VVSFAPRYSREDSQWVVPSAGLVALEKGILFLSPYENQTTNPLLLSMWSSHYADCAREQFDGRYSHVWSQLAYWCHAYFYKSVLSYLKTRTVHNKPVLLLPRRKMLLQDN
jgi:hypothetical protein